MKVTIFPISAPIGNHFLSEQGTWLFQIDF